MKCREVVVASSESMYVPCTIPIPMHIRTSSFLFSRSISPLSLPTLLSSVLMMSFFTRHVLFIGLLHLSPACLTGVPRRIRLDDGIATAIGEHESKQSDEQNTTPNFSLHQETSELSIYMLSMITLAEMSMSDTKDKTFYPTIATEYPTMYPTIRDEELGSSTGHEEGEGWWWSDGI